MELVIRRERPGDYRAVEELVREAFWNLNVPGCSEHLVAHKLRGSAAFVPALDLVAELGGEIAGSIMFARAVIELKAGGELETLTFGPLAVRPDILGRGVGAALVTRALALAKEASFGSVVIFGNPKYYARFGFVPAKDYKITTQYGVYAAALLALELKEGALANAAGRFYEGEAYEAGEDETEAFDSSFEPKEKLETETQRAFSERVTMVETPQD